MLGVEDNEGHTPESDARANGHEDVVRFLIAHRAKIAQQQGQRDSSQHKAACDVTEMRTCKAGLGHRSGLGQLGGAGSTETRARASRDDPARHPVGPYLYRTVSNPSWRAARQIGAERSGRR